MSDILAFEPVITEAWEKRAELSSTTLSSETGGRVREAVEAVLAALDAGQVRVSSRENGTWVVHQWLKKAVLLSFRLSSNRLISGASDGGSYYDKVSLKWSGWGEKEFQSAGFRAVPGAIVRHSAFIAKDVVLMPSFVNVGAYVDEGTMVDTWATVGSCAQIGKNCHISGGAGIGGVLEPLQANPVILEDNVFVGARSEVAEGVIVEEGAVLAMGVFLSQSTKIFDRQTGEVFYGRVPSYSVVVPGTLPASSGEAALACAVIVKRVDEKTRAKTSINALLRS